MQLEDAAADNLPTAATFRGCIDGCNVGRSVASVSCRCPLGEELLALTGTVGGVRFNDDPVPGVDVDCAEGRRAGNVGVRGRVGVDERSGLLLVLPTN